MEIRLQKILAGMGIASRRKADDMIKDGRVTVNGQIANLGMKADPMLDHIKLDGKLLTRTAEPKVYLMMHKPANVMTTLSDPEDRPTVMDYLKRVKVRVYPVGRLDFDSEGLILLTNDGDFAHMVMHPSKRLPKTYRVKIKGLLSEAAIGKLEAGVKLMDGRTAPAKIKKLRKLEENSWVEITIHEGRKRQVRRMLQHVGHHVIRLIRVRIGGLSLGTLTPGETRRLKPDEVEMIVAQASGEQL